MLVVEMSHGWRLNLGFKDHLCGYEDLLAVVKSVELLNVDNLNIDFLVLFQAVLTTLSKCQREAHRCSTS